MPRRLLNIESIVCLVLCVALMGMRVTFGDEKASVRERFVNDAPVAWAKAAPID